MSSNTNHGVSYIRLQTLVTPQAFPDEILDQITFTAEDKSLLWHGKPLYLTGDINSFCIYCIQYGRQRRVHETLGGNSNVHFSELRAEIQVIRIRRYNQVHVHLHIPLQSSPLTLDLIVQIFRVLTTKNIDDVDNKSENVYH